jgi:ribosomal protein S12 methylthiotransferase
LKLRRADFFREIRLPTQPTPKSMPKRTVAIVSLGCPKNLVDSERMLGLLKRHGYRMVREPEGADAVIVNTCGFLEIARQESLDTIREMVQLKERGHVGGVIVAGCLAERDKEGLLEQCPGIDQVVGVFGREEIVEVAGRLSAAQPGERTLFRPAARKALPDGDRLRITLPHLAFLKIAEGCDRLCTFCSIPNMRGQYVSKPVEQVVEEAQQLAADGVRELILVAQDTSYYGVDLSGQPQLAQLLVRLEQVAGLEWIRVMYLYPMHLTEEFFEVLVSSRKALRYLDLPLQHINDKILRRMKRQVTRAETERLLERLRERIPGVVLRTTLIVGFPGETEAQFDELLAFVDRWRFERLGVFAYSREPDTPAARLPDHVPPEVAQERRDKLLATQQEIAFQWNRSQVGRSLEILIDGCIPGEQNACVGRSYADAPEVDGLVYISGQSLRPGQFVSGEVVAAKEYDLIAAAVGKPR